MTLREGVNSPLMKFAEDIKLEGVVNTNEDSKVLQRDQGGPWQDTELAGVLGRKLLGRLGTREGHLQGWCGTGRGHR
jgi:hypothetical protein